jgi:hypothetical protein
MATFFTYKGFDGKFDTGLTEHSGCPVFEGEKWIATTWMREGVSTQHTWESFDPSGIPMVVDSAPSSSEPEDLENDDTEFEEEKTDTCSEDEL